MILPYEHARRLFEAECSPTTLRQAVTFLARNNIDASDICSWARSVSIEFGIWDYVGPNFDAHIMGPALRLVQPT